MFSSSRLRTSVYLVSGVILALTAVSWATSDDLLRGGKATARAEGEGQLSDDGFGGGDVPFIRMGDWRAADGGSPDLPFAFVQGKNVGVMVTTDSDGNFTAKVNGEEVDESRIRRNGDDVDVLDEDGSVLLHFRMPTQGKIEFPFGGRTWFPPRQEEPVRRAAIGIRMETASDALAYHLDLQDPAVMVTDVVEGLPAADAGVQRFDVITSVDGKSGVTLESLRDAVASHQEGETIRFEIVRRGQRHTVDVPVVMREMPSTARWVEDNFPVRPDVFWSPFDSGRDGNPLNSRLFRFDPQEPDLHSFWNRSRGVDAPDDDGEPATDAISDFDRLEKRLERLEKLLERLEKKSD